MGKTVVARAIIRAFVRLGYRVAVAKPVESGAEIVNGQLAPADALALRTAASESIPIQDICEYCFPSPVSPHVAADLAGEKIEADLILAMLDRRAEGADLIVAEGAGGLLVPLSGDVLYADVIARTGFELVIVAPNVLGAINTTLLTIEAARKRRIRVAGVVLNRTPALSLGNAGAIARHGRVPILGEMPDMPTTDDDILADLAESHISLDALAGDSA